MIKYKLAHNKVLSNKIQFANVNNNDELYSLVAERFGYRNMGSGLLGKGRDRIQIIIVQ